MKRYSKKADLCLNVTVTPLLQMNCFDILLMFVRNVKGMENEQTFRLVYVQRTFSRNLLV